MVFRNLAAGNYLLTAMRSGYVRTYYGSKLPGRGPGVAVTVLDGQKVGDIQIRMLRGSVLTGTVRTATGRPAPNQSVQATMVRSSGGDRRAVQLEGGARLSRHRRPGRLSHFRSCSRRLHRPRPVNRVWIGRAAADDEPPNCSGRTRWWRGGATAAPPTGLPAAPGAAAVRGIRTRLLSRHVRRERRGRDHAQAQRRARGRGLFPAVRAHGPDHRPCRRRRRAADERHQRDAPADANRRHRICLPSLFNSSARTGADGVFTVRGVKPGAYTMTARATPQAAPATNTDHTAEPRGDDAAGNGGHHGRRRRLDALCAGGRRRFRAATSPTSS